MATSKRLLILTSRPDGPAFRQRIGAYLGALAERGVTCEVATPVRCPINRAAQLSAARKFDGVLIQKKMLTGWDAFFLRRTGRPVIYDFDDAVRYKASAPDTPNRSRITKFARTIALATRVIAGSEVLAAVARDAGATAVDVVPTGLDVGHYKPASGGAPGRLKLVWIGARSTLKQLQRLTAALEAVGREVPGVSLRIIADAELTLDSLDVENLPWSPATEADLLAECDAGIAPLPDTPFTRGKCGFKVLQYMASSLPVITSPVGVNADYVVDGESGFHAESSDQWVEAARRLLDDVDLRRRMGAVGRHRVEPFDFTAIAPRFCDVVCEALGMS